MAPKTLGPKRGSVGSPASQRGAGTEAGTPPPPPLATTGERANVCLRIRPALTEEEGQDNTALQCDRANRLVWALGESEEGEPEQAPRQYAFDEVLEQHVGQAEVRVRVGTTPPSLSRYSFVPSPFFGITTAARPFLANHTLGGVLSGL